MKAALERELERLGRRLSEAAYCVRFLSAQLTTERERQEVLWGLWYDVQQKLDALHSTDKGAQGEHSEHSEHSEEV